MIYLFIHQNLPAQYRHIVRYLADQPGNTVYFITQPNGNEMRGVNKIVYAREPRTDVRCHPYTTEFDQAVAVGARVAEVCQMLRDQQVRPDIIVGHCGWGETLFIKDVFPDVPLLSYFEFYYHARGVDVDFDPEFSTIFYHPSRLRTRNGVALLSYDASDWGNTPTMWQRSLHPPEMRRRMSVIHEGVDTSLIVPNPQAVLELPDRGLSLKHGDEVLTYVARNLEPYRGFHVFMRALPEVLKRRPNAQVLVVGGDSVSYGAAAAPRSSYREMMLAELGSRLDTSRVHFLGQVDYAVYQKLLQISSAHVYLTYPFVLSWSFIEAMSSACLLIGSSTPPVMEVLEDGVNGLAVDFFDTAALVDRIVEALANPARFRALREAARETAVSRYDLKQVLLPRWVKLLDDLIAGQRPDLGLH